MCTIQKKHCYVFNIKCTPHLPFREFTKQGIYGTAHFQLHAREHRIASECLFFSCTLLKLACSITQLACSITPLACSNLLVVTGLLACARALTRVACIAITLRILIARYMFTPVSYVHYLSSGNSPVNVRIGKHICKGRGLVLLVSYRASENQPFERKLH